MPDQVQPADSGRASQLAPGMIRQTIIMDRAARDEFAKLSSSINQTQGHLLEAIIYVLEHDQGVWEKVVKRSETMPKRAMFRTGVVKQYREQLASVPTAELEAFLRERGVAK